MIAKKSALAVFFATVVISLVLYLPGLLRFTLAMHYFNLGPHYWLSISQTLIVFFIEVPVGFAFFYYFAKKTRIHLDRSVVAALLAGLFVGNIPFMLLPYPIGSVDVFGSSDVATGMYLGALQGNIFCVFFPALVAILFVELNNKRANNLLIPSTDSPSTE